ncbi:hypothetical protein A2U01_0019987, partial [Trifolium medium]|nr:hypothetical protein [Trifolium medium]
MFQPSGTFGMVYLMHLKRRLLETKCCSILLAMERDILPTFREQHVRINFTIAVDACNRGGILEASHERVGSSTSTPPPFSEALLQLERRRVGHPADPCLTACESFQTA